MDISGYSNINTVLSQLQQAKAGQANQTAASSGAGSGNSTVSTNNSTSSRTALANSLMQALYQFNSQQGLASWLGENTQSSGNDFVNQLFSAMPDAGNAATNAATKASTTASASQAAAYAPALDRNSPTYALQQGIQNLITQLDRQSGTGSGSVPGAANTGGSGSGQNLSALQASFNTLIKNSGGNPDGASLSAFLKLVSAQIQNVPLSGGLFSASA